MILVFESLCLLLSPSDYRLCISEEVSLCENSDESVSILWHFNVVETVETTPVQIEGVA